VHGTNSKEALEAMAVIITIIVAVVFIGAAAGGWARYNTRKLRASFGPEYETVAQAHDTPREVDRELRRRKSEHAGLDLHPIGPKDQEFYTTSWNSLQGGFLDAPSLSLSSAESLVAKVLDARGYPGEDPDEQLALLSVRYAHSLADYRAAQAISRHAKADPGAAGTEELRQALLSYHVLFTEILEDQDTGKVS